MTRIPGRREVDRALRDVAREVKKSLKELNRQAAKLLARGDYSSAEAMVSIGRSVSEFGPKIEVLREQWELALQSRLVDASPPEETALWKFYKPVLQALTSLGGDARTEDLEKRLEPSFAASLKPGDRLVGRQGIARWKLMLKKSRRHMAKEGFLEDGGGKLWRITAAGRRAAQEETALGSD